MRWDSEKRIAARLRREQWHRWFALWPVHVGNGHYAWLEWVERRVEYVSGFDGTYAFPKYRTVGQSPPLTITDVLAAHAQFGSLDRDMLKAAMGDSWSDQYACLCEPK